MVVYYIWFLHTTLCMCAMLFKFHLRCNTGYILSRHEYVIQLRYFPISFRIKLPSRVSETMLLASINCTNSNCLYRYVIGRQSITTFQARCSAAPVQGAGPGRIISFVSRPPRCELMHARTRVVGVPVVCVWWNILLKWYLDLNTQFFPNYVYLLILLLSFACFRWYHYDWALAKIVSIWAHRGKTRQTPGHRLAGRPSGFLTRYCDVSFYPIELEFVPFGIKTIKLQVI